MGAIPVHHTDVVDAPWDAAANLKRLGDEPTEQQLRLMHAWVDSDGDPLAKSSYKLPHHMVDTDGNVGAANIKACISAIAALNGARGGVDIPESHRRPVYRHLVAHLLDADIEPPALRKSDFFGECGPERRSGALEIKRLTDEGEFIGLASVFGNVDEGGDVVEPGAFKKTLAERGPEVPILWHHDPTQPIGIGRVEETDEGLLVHGKLELALDEARKAYIRLKRGLVRGLSIGYKTIKDSIEGGVRRLKELRLYEVSLVTFPMNELARVQQVKSDSLSDTFEVAQVWGLRYHLLVSLCDALDAVVADTRVSVDDKDEAIEACIDQFREQYLQHLPRLVAVLHGQYAAIIRAFEESNGRPIGASTRQAIDKSIYSLKALLDGEATQATPPSGAAAGSDEPADDHSLQAGDLKQIADLLRRELPL